MAALFCPVCRKAIDTLYTKMEGESRISTDGRGGISIDPFDESVCLEEFSCPLCEATIDIDDLMLESEL